MALCHRLSILVSQYFTRLAISCLHSIDCSPVAFCHCLKISLPSFCPVSCSCCLMDHSLLLLVSPFCLSICLSTHLQYCLLPVGTMLVFGVLPIWNNLYHHCTCKFECLLKLKSLNVYSNSYVLDVCDLSIRKATHLP